MEVSPQLGQRRDGGAGELRRKWQASADSAQSLEANIACLTVEANVAWEQRELASDVEDRGKTIGLGGFEVELRRFGEASRNAAAVRMLIEEEAAGDLEHELLECGQLGEGVDGR